MIYDSVILGDCRVARDGYRRHRFAIASRYNEVYTTKKRLIATGVVNIRAHMIPT